MQLTDWRPPLKALTGLRFVAAAHVVFYHFGAPVVTGAPVWLTNLLAGGDSAVSLFFILSGFVLAYNYADRGPVRLREFWVARFARIYPAYLLALVVVAPFTVPGLGLGRTLLTTIITTTTLTHAWFWQTATRWNFPSWSLSAEAFFYLLFPLILPVVRLQGRRLYVAVSTLWGLGLVAPIAYAALDPDHLGGIFPTNSDPPWLATVAYNPILHLPEFLIGMLIARAFLARRVGGGAKAISVGAVLCILGIFLASDRVPIPLLHNGLLSPIFAVLVYALARGVGPVAWLLSRAPIVFLGEASYAMYILQYPVWRWITLISGQSDGSPAVLIVFFLVLTGCAVLCLVVVERPSRRGIRRLLAGRAQPFSKPQLNLNTNL